MESIGQFAIATMLETLNAFFIDTYTALAGSFHTTATLGVTLFLVFMGYRASAGKVGESLQEFITLCVSVPLAFGIFFHPGIFQEWIYQPIMSAMFGLMGLAMGNDTFTLSAMFKPVDGAFASIFEAVSKLTGQMDSWDLGLKLQVYTVSLILGVVFAVLYAYFTVLIIMSLFSIHVMIIFGPIFGFLAAFKQTRSYFFTWLKTIISYALVPVFTAVVMGITLKFLNLATTDILDINVIEDGVFTVAIGGALFVGVMSIALHRKASEYASALTGAQISGADGFFGGAAMVAGGGMAAASALGGNSLSKKLGGLRDSGLSKMGEMGKTGMHNAYSKLRGFSK